MSHDQQPLTETGQFKAILARKYPNLRMELLEGMNEEIGTLNNGSGNLLIRMKDFLPDWIDSTRRKFFQRNPHKK